MRRAHHQSPSVIKRNNPQRAAARKNPTGFPKQLLGGERRYATGNRDRVAGRSVQGKIRIQVLAQSVQCALASVRAGLDRRKECSSKLSRSLHFPRVGAPVSAQAPEGCPRDDEYGKRRENCEIELQMKSAHALGVLAPRKYIAGSAHREYPLGLLRII